MIKNFPRNAVSLPEEAKKIIFDDFYFQKHGVFRVCANEKRGEICLRIGNIFFHNYIGANKSSTKSGIASNAVCFGTRSALRLGG